MVNDDAALNEQQCGWHPGLTIGAMMTASIIPFDPNNSAMVLAQDEVTAARIAALLNTALFDAEIDEDGDIYVNDGLEFPVWISVLHSDRLLQLFTYFTADDDAPIPTLEAVNDMNKNVKLPQFFLSGDKVCASFWIAYDGGLPSKQFVRSLRRFASAFLAGLRL